MNQGTVRSKQQSALAGVKVIDMTQFEAGTSCTETLAWLGADVIKIEEPTKGEQGRRASTEDANIDSPYFLLLNANKRSVTINVKDERGRQILRELIKQGDVFVENFGPGAIERLGFGYDVVKEINPRIIYAQIKGFSAGSPYEKFPAFDMTAQAVGGSLATTGEEGGRPIRPGPTLGDTGAGLHTAIGILAALHQRQSDGEGQHVEVAMQEAVINFGRIAYASLALYGKSAPRHGNQSVLGSAPSEVYRCKGGGENDYCYIYTSRAGNQQWERLLKVIGREDLMDDPRFNSPLERYRYREEVDAIVTEWTLKHDKREVMEILGAVNVPGGAVFDTKELRDDPHLRKRGMFVTVKHPTRGDFTMPGWPVTMSKSNVPVVAAPLLGQHTEEVFRQMLGYTPEQIAGLKAEKVI
ncbi:MAG: hypothetical protein A3G81_31310 [Betaproteobacteria bacterium RIFCSPLOWO2_12_FULL_65_14]|nr:MAG: hypothetical protein A3G81_31310 [Betaproteobacteria bacterium RIFCSPLOWO2_12_FULL_65_14]